MLSSSIGYGITHGFVGPMFSEKTTELLRTLSLFDRMRSVQVFLLKPAIDTRWSSASTATNAVVGTHSNLLRRENAMVVTSGDHAIQQLRSQPISETTRTVVVGLDEAQFVPNLISLFEWILGPRPGDHPWNRIEVRLYFSALNGTFDRKPFPEIAAIEPLTTEKKILSGVCGCCEMSKSHFSRRDVKSQELVLLGGADDYTAVCARCFHHSGRCSNNSSATVTVDLSSE